MGGSARWRLRSVHSNKHTSDTPHTHTNKQTKPHLRTSIVSAMTRMASSCAAKSWRGWAYVLYIWIVWFGYRAGESPGHWRICFPPPKNRGMGGLKQRHARVEVDRVDAPARQRWVGLHGFTVAHVPSMQVSVWCTSHRSGPIPKHIEPSKTHKQNSQDPPLLLLLPGPTAAATRRRGRGGRVRAGEQQERGARAVVGIEQRDA